MIYSAGYQRMPLDDFLSLVKRLGVGVVIDARSVPSSRKAGYSRRALAEVFKQGATHYAWAGDMLGGRRGTFKPAGLKMLRDLEHCGATALVLCMEEAPGECHRHHAIATALLPEIDVLHIFRDHAVRASELQRAFDRDVDEYETVRLP